MPMNLKSLCCQSRSELFPLFIIHMACVGGSSRGGKDGRLQSAPPARSNGAGGKPPYKSNSFMNERFEDRRDENKENRSSK